MGRKKTDSTSTYNLSMRIYCRYYIGLSKSVIIVLGEPDYLNFWWSEKERAVLVGPADVPNFFSVSLNGFSCSNTNSPVICNRKLVKAINLLISKEDEISQKLRGDYIPEVKMVAFRTGVIINSK